MGDILHEQRKQPERAATLGPSLLLMLLVVIILIGATIGTWISAGVGSVLTNMMSGFVGNTGNAMIVKLLTRGGMSSMYGTIGIMCWSLCMAGLMMRCGIISSIMDKVRHFCLVGCINPIFVMICAFTGFGIFKAEKKAAEK